MMRAVRITRTGGPEVLEYVEVPTPIVGDGQVLVRAHFIGVGMPEILVRRGEYPWMPRLPAIPGIEMSGTVEAVGNGVTGLRLGQRVFVSARELAERGGCYAEFIAVDAHAAYGLPGDADLKSAACLSNYQVAWHLLHSPICGMSFDTVLIMAASGGVGSAAVQLAKIAGKTVVGLVSSEAKGQFVERLGADHVVNHKTEDDMVSRVRAATGGRGVDLILDSVGGPHFARNFDMLAPFGLVVLYGALDGWPPPESALSPLRSRIGFSPGVRTFSMHAFDSDRERRAKAVADLAALLVAGSIRPLIHDCLPLAQARRAHELMEARSVAGKLLLVP